MHVQAGAYNSDIIPFPNHLRVAQTVVVATATSTSFQIPL